MSAAERLELALLIKAITPVTIDCFPAVKNYTTYALYTNS